jgi:hypothetical protein
MKNLILILTVATFAGCATKQTGQLDRWHKAIQVQTEPSGQRIYFAISSTEKSAIENREYIGQSPCSVIVKIDGDGRFDNTISGFVHPVAVFQAEPDATATNLFPQKQDFKVPAAFYHAPKAPDAVFFDMRKSPAS